MSYLFIARYRCPSSTRSFIIERMTIFDSTFIPNPNVKRLRSESKYEAV